MTLRILRWIALTTGVLMIVAFVGTLLLGVGFIGFFFYASAVPARMTVAGRVTDNARKPMESVSVRAVPRPVMSSFSDHHLQTGAVEHWMTTDSSGRYRLEGLIAAGGVKEGAWVQEWDIVARADGFAAQRIRVMKGRSLSGLNVSLPDFVLVPSAKIAGRVVDTRGRPVAGRVLRITPVEKLDDEPFVRRNVVPKYKKTDNDGGFAFGGVPPDTYVLEIAAFPEHQNVRQRVRNTSFTIEAGEELADLEIVAESPEDRGAIVGRVVDGATSSPVNEFTLKLPRADSPFGEGAAVHGLLPKDGRGEPLSRYSEVKVEDGSFRITQVSPGTATLEIAAEGYARKTVLAPIESGSTTTLTIPLVAEGIIEGVATRNGQACGYGYVRARQVGETAGGEGIDLSVGTDAEGRFEFRHLPAGEYHVRLTVWLKENPECKAQLTDHFRVTVEPGETVRIDRDFGHPGTIRGRFSGADRDLEWQVRIYDPATSDSTLVEDDRLRAVAWKFAHSGWYSIESVAPGTYEVVAIGYRKAKDGPQTPLKKVPMAVTVGEGQTVDVDFDFR
jgi:hypothetical protein